MGTPVQFDQVQGIARFGYRMLTECSFVLLAIEDAAAARRWIGSAPVSNAVAQPSAPETALQIAFTHEGLQRLGLAPEVLAQFSMEFRSGQGSSTARSRLLGDVGESAPEHWAWGAGENAPHLLLMLYAKPGQLSSWRRSLQTPDWDAAFRILAELPTANMDGIEPFGFPDGLSQPELDWDRQRDPPAIEDTYTSKIALGEFLLGYPNEYSRYTDRPLLPATAAFAQLLPEAEDVRAMRDLGRNGSYLVLRTLLQDVEGFWHFLRIEAGSDEGARSLAEAMVGRRKDGTPLAATDGPLPGSGAEPHNRFRFDKDPDGTRCPFGAHIRRANPRNGDLPDPPVTGVRRWLALLGLGPKTLHSDSKASARFHRILRRGREFGPPEPGTQTEDGKPLIAGAGIHFICLVANIARQFEFLQNAWMMSTKFDSMTDESDPLLGSREPVEGSGPADTFTIPSATGINRTVCGMPRFITVRGGGYFFLPSIPALQYLSKMK